jgi:hypothetical protein
MGENKALAVARQPLELEGLPWLRGIGRRSDCACAKH